MIASVGARGIRLPSSARASSESARPRSGRCRNVGLSGAREATSNIPRPVMSAGSTSDITASFAAA